MQFATLSVVIKDLGPHSCLLVTQKGGVWAGLRVRRSDTLLPGRSLAQSPGLGVPFIPRTVLRGGSGPIG